MCHCLNVIHILSYVIPIRKIIVKGVWFNKKKIIKKTNIVKRHFPFRWIFTAGEISSLLILFVVFDSKLESQKRQKHLKKCLRIAQILIDSQTLLKIQH